MLEYKGFEIEFNLYNKYEFSLQYCGDDFIFFSLAEAHNFIDEITSEADHD